MQHSTSVVMLRAFKLTVVTMFSIVMLSVVMVSVNYAEGHDEGRYAECH
jgi:hypothetical protein